MLCFHPLLRCRTLALWLTGALFFPATALAALISTSPHSNENGVGRTEPLELRFDQPVSARAEVLSLSCNGIPISFSRFSGAENVERITLYPDSGYGTNSICTATVSANALTPALEADYQWQFSTTNPPPRYYELRVAVQGEGVIQGSGIDCGEDCAHAYSRDTRVSLSATPAAGWTFAAWEGQCDAEGVAWMLGSRECSARFISATDADSDGVDNAVENAAPNSGDGNGDGIADAEQAHVISLPDAETGAYIILEAGAQCAFEGAQADAASALPTDADYRYPQGILSFAARCSNSGFSWYGHGLDSLAGLTYRRYGPTPPGATDAVWGDFPATVDWRDINGQAVVRGYFSITDNGSGDDSADDGLIIHSGAPALPNFTDVGFTQGTFSVAENAGEFLLPLSRSLAGEPLRLHYAASDDSARAGADYELAAGTLEWTEDQLSATIPLTLIDNSELDGERRLLVSLELESGTSHGLMDAWVTIQNEDVPPPVDTQSARFAHGDLWVGEYAENLIVQVLRQESEYAGSTQLSTLDGSALAGIDYQTTAATLNWNSGDAAPQAVLVPLLDDGLDDGDKSFSLRLDNGEQISVHVQAAAAGEIGFASAQAFVKEAAGWTVLLLERRDSANGEARVRLYSEDDSAKAGEDYLAHDEIITWADGEQGIKRVLLRLLDDRAQEAEETLWVRLESGGNGTRVDTDTLRLIIQDDDPCLPAGIIYNADLDSTSPYSGVCSNTQLHTDVGVSGTQLEVAQHARVSLSAHMQVDAANATGEPIELLALAVHTLADGSQRVYSRNETRWEERPQPLNLGQLPRFAAGQLDTRINFDIAQLMTNLPGYFRAYVGYRLSDGRIVFNSEEQISLLVY